MTGTPEVIYQISTVQQVGRRKVESGSFRMQTGQTTLHPSSACHRRA